MSVRANPTTIGFFLVGAVVLAIGGTFVLASPTWFQNRPTFISFFPESVNGLENGAPVKFQGVPVGRVTGINIEIDQRDHSFQVPVEYEIDLARLTTPSGKFVNLSDTVVLRQQLEQGLRAQLQMESFVTGVLYVELSYRSGSAAPKLASRAQMLPEIPITASLMSAIGGGAGSLLGEVMKIMDKVNGMLNDVNVREVNAAVMQSANAVQELLTSPELRATLRQMPGAAAQLNSTMLEAQRLAARATQAIDPMQAHVSGVSAEARSTLEALRKTLDETQGLVSADTGPGYELTGALRSLREAADALTVLITSLEQNPDMLLRGKKPPQNR